MCFVFFFFKQKTAYEMRISDWSSDVCSSDLLRAARLRSHGAWLCQKPLAHLSTSGCARRPCPKGRVRYHGGVLQAARSARYRARSRRTAGDRKSVVAGKSVSVRVDLGGRRIIKKKKNTIHINNTKENK